MKTKVIALYLPQFHEIKENIEWWGNGFTEWTNVKNAQKYTSKQRQPRVPLNNNYYDLSKKKDIYHQSKIAKDYGIDGFCIYHYYSIGKKLLEKPAEIIRDNKDIDIEYFFSWANHDWRRVWASSSKEILRKQEYGSDKEIIEHFKYLLTFFKDDRYIKIDNKPVFAIYQNIEKETFQKIYDIWDKMSKEEGFDGIYWIGTLSNVNSNFDVQMNNYFRFEPNYTRSKLNKNVIIYQKAKQKIYSILNKKIIKRPYSFDYKFICKNILNTSKYDKDNLLGIFTGWDNTPRYKNNGYYYINESPKTFEVYFKQQLELSIKNNNYFVFINAWNEWGEGNYVEPDIQWGHGFLDAIRNNIDK